MFVDTSVYIWMCIFICTCILMICMKQMYKLFSIDVLLPICHFLLDCCWGRGLVLHAKMLLGGRDHYNCCIECGILNVL